MFEDSLFASGISSDTKRSARRRRWFALASVGVQGLALTGFIVLPIIFPATLPAMALAPKVLLAPVHKPEVKVQPKPVHVETTNTAAMRAPSVQPTVEAHKGGVITPITSVPFDNEAPSLYVGGGTDKAALAAVLGRDPGSGAGPAVVAVTAAPTKKPEPLVISQGVSKGMLLAPIQPIYPRIAIAAKIEGTVVVTAIIDKNGRITGLKVLSGPPMLQTAAADAVKEARYRPFLLSGEPTDVITTISVTFRLGA